MHHIESTSNGDSAVFSRVSECARAFTFTKLVSKGYYFEGLEL